MRFLNNIIKLVISLVIEFVSVTVAVFGIIIGTNGIENFLYMNPIQHYFVDPTFLPFEVFTIHWIISYFIVVICVVLAAYIHSFIKLMFNNNIVFKIISIFTVLFINFIYFINIYAIMLKDDYNYIFLFLTLILYNVISIGIIKKKLY